MKCPSSLERFSKSPLAGDVINTAVPSGEINYYYNIITIVHQYGTQYAILSQRENVDV
jgi:hypothetical protein